MPERCDHCGGAVTSEVGQGVVGDRLSWSVWTRCGSCGDAEQECGWDSMPEALRDELIGEVGLVRLHAEGPRKRLLAVFRQDGATIEEAVAACRALGNEGLVGTPAEMELLGLRLRAAGATVETAGGA
ncbi:hypothetical protein AB0J83_28550 [Actinoplanes sp. NPDC049596]|uniref:hypothetical protein n=1 Tax=unclassified Actinoplanes TaxID=2626549 RepID=UPI0034230449